MRRTTMRKEQREKSGNVKSNNEQDEKNSNMKRTIVRKEQHEKSGNVKRATREKWPREEQQ